MGSRKGKKTTSVVSGTRGRVRKEGAEFPVIPPRSSMPVSYKKLVSELKARIQRARVSVANAANQELLLLYFSMGFDLDRRLREEAWGTGIIDRVSVELRAAFPEMGGLSSRNLRRMRSFYHAYSGSSKSAAIWPQAVAKLPPPK